MGLFDILINSNKSPKENMEYIILHNMIWKIGDFEHTNCEYGTIVTDVKKMDNDSFVFKLKDTGEEYSTNYGWALAENTPENLKLIEEFNDKERMYMVAKKLRDEARLSISTLDGPSKLK